MVDEKVGCQTSKKVGCKGGTIVGLQDLGYAEVGKQIPKAFRGGQSCLIRKRAQKGKSSADINDKQNIIVA